MVEIDWHALRPKRWGAQKESVVTGCVGAGLLPKVWEHLHKAVKQGMPKGTSCTYEQENHAHFITDSSGAVLGVVFDYFTNGVVFLDFVDANGDAVADISICMDIKANVIDFVRRFAEYPEQVGIDSW